MFGIGYDKPINEKLKAIIQQRKDMSYRPSFTVGRGACLSDLNSEKIEFIYQGVVKEFGEDSGKAYIQMVKELKEASATSFLINLYELCNNGWKNIPIDNTGIRVDKDEDGNYTEEGIAGASHGIMENMFHFGRNDTDRIKWPFLKKHGVKLELDKFGSTYYY